MEKYFFLCVRCPVGTWAIQSWTQVTIYALLTLKQLLNISYEWSHLCNANSTVPKLQFIRKICHLLSIYATFTTAINKKSFRIFCAYQGVVHIFWL